MINPDKREAPIAIEETRAIPQPEREPAPHALPASMYAAQLPLEVVQQDIRTVQQGIQEHVAGPTIASTIVDEHWSHSGDRVVTAADDYAADLYQSVLKHPDYTAEQRIEQMQPTPAERQH